MACRQFLIETGVWKRFQTGAWKVMMSSPMRNMNGVSMLVASCKPKGQLDSTMVLHHYEPSSGPHRTAPKERATATVCALPWRSDKLSNRTVHTIGGRVLQRFYKSFY